MPQPRRVVVTGANRGLGLEFVRQLLDRGDDVCALTRQPQDPILQRVVAGSGGAVEALRCDVTDDAEVRAAAARIGGRWQSVDLLVNNAGIAGKTVGGLADLDAAELHRAFEVNAVAPLRVARALLPLLRGGRDPKIASITSRMGSIADNDSGGWWSYRMSKAALNMAGKNLALELRPLGVACLVLHPGWVRTDMGGEAAPLSPRESVAGMMEVIDRLTLADTGCFRDFHDEVVPY